MTLEERIKEMEEIANQKVAKNPTYRGAITRKNDAHIAKKALSIIDALINKFRQTLVEERLKIQDLRENVRELQNKNKELEAQQEAETMYYESKNENLTRLEVIDESGSVYVNNNCKMELSYDKR
jgi:hypothetical protein